MYCHPGEMGVTEDQVETKETAYHYMRLINGVPEGPKETQSKLPLNLNFHKLNSISFDKGCYLGHELTQRTFHTGVL